MHAAKQGKARTYAELVHGSRCRLVVVAMGKGAQKVRLLAKARSRTAVKISIARWSALLTLAAHVPLAASLNTQGPAQQTSPDGDIARLLAPCWNIAPPDPHPRHPSSVYDLGGPSPRPSNYGV